MANWVFDLNLPKYVAMATIGTDIQKAANELKRGNLVGIPTETVYGLAGNVFDTEAVTRIFEVKNRPSFDPLIVHLSSAEHLGRIVTEIPETAKILAAHFWPGPLTLVLPRKDVVPDLVTSGLPTVAVRVPDHPVTRELLDCLPFPLACPSANPFGYVSPTTASHVSDQLGSLIDYILDGGPCRVGIESTILGFEDKLPVIYRPGGISIEEIEKVVGRTLVKSSFSKPLAPGMFKSHYAPAKSLMIGNINELITRYGTKQSGILSFKDHFDQVADEYQIRLSPEGNLAQAAQNLFASLRKLDAMDIRYIFTELVPDYGLGVAINNRLRRAASKLIET